MASTLPYTLARALSRKGSSHTRNEDRYALMDARQEGVRRVRRGAIYMVADGVSSAGDGDSAAETAVECLGEFFTSGRPPSEDLLIDLVESADAQVRMTTGSACTLTGIWLADGVVSIFNLGDSAVYLFRDDHLRRLTPVQTRGGGLAAYLGMGQGVRHSLFLERMPFAVGDTFLVASDGVFGAVELSELRHLVSRAPDDGWLNEVDMRLRERGHGDDATLVSVQVLGVEASPWQERAMADG